MEHEFKKETKKMDLKEIEFWEHHYLSQIEFTLTQDLSKMIEGLNSKDKIKEDWIEHFKRIDKQRQNSDFARGAERIYFWLFNQFGIPNSSPIGADLFFETYNAFVHIDIKTAKYDNPSDYKGKVPIGENQTSYKIDKKYNVNLPAIYKYENKICLTYVLNIVYDDSQPELQIKTIILVSVPNGKLKSIYGKDIIGAGKSKGKSFRFEYKNKPYFELLENKSLRVKVIFRADDVDIKDITTLEL
jgi:hypothetical protein